MNALNHRKVYQVLILLMTSLAFSLCIDAQTIKNLSNLNKEKLKKADEYYNLLEFQRAVEIYLEIAHKAESDTAILCRIANSYRMLNDHAKAEEWYRKVVVNNGSTINHYKLSFAQELATNKKYDEALYWFKEYNKSAINDQRALASIKSIENLSTLYYDTTFYVIYPVPINTQYAEFCPTFYKDNILFLTDRNNSKTSFLSWYVSKPDSDGTLAEAIKFDNKIKTPYNAGPLTFYENYSKVIFSQNYAPERLKKKQVNEVSLQLFSADVGDNNQWTNIQLLPIGNNEYSNTQPSVSEDGNTLYFSSNAPGGYGGADLYKSEMKNGQWGIPLNLGETINTMGDEMFPFIFHDTVLFFSSNGHGGLGGLDLMKINLTKKDNKIEHIGTPINSPNDDFGIVMNKDDLSGYFSSNRTGGAGSDDIYRFKVIRITYTMKIIDENTTLPIPNVGIYSTDEKQIGATDENGSYSMNIPVSQVFQFKIKKDKYESKIYTIDPPKMASRKLEVISLKTSKEEPVLLTDQNNQIIENPTNVVYKVQILASTDPATDQELRKKYKGSLKIFNFYEDEWYKYSIGGYASYTEAKDQLIKCEVYDAFIIAYINSKKVHITIAKTATKEINVKSPASREELYNH